MQNQKVIEQLGYSSKEAKVYLTALSLGEARLTDISKKVKLPRSSVQAIIEKLHKHGLMTFYKMRRYKYWVAENPERLLSRLQQREINIRDALPSLLEMKRKSRSNRLNKENDEKHLMLFRMIADASYQPVLIANHELNIEYVNYAWENQFGYTLDEIKGRDSRMFKSGKTPPEVYVKMWEVLRKGKLFQTDEIIDQRKNGTFINLLTSIFPLNHNGHTIYIQILDDITEEKRIDGLHKRFTKMAD